MSFGKRDGNNVGALRQLAQTTSVQASSSRRTAKSSSGGEAAFIALALGVVAVSAAGAFAAPSIISFVSSLGSTSVRPIATVVAGLDRDRAKAALAKEAFPDKLGSAFMSGLAANFPQEHDLLLGHLADAALQGGDRDALMLAVNEWTMQFTVANLPALGRTGASGFDKAMGVISEALDFVEETAGGNCNANAILALASDPVALSKLSGFGSTGYKLNMKSNRVIVDLAAAGRNAPQPDTTLTRQDEAALQSVVFALMSDKQLMSAVQQSMQGQMNAGSIPPDLNVCALGRIVLVKLKAMPPGTKSRLLALGASQAIPAMRSFPLASR